MGLNSKSSTYRYKDFNNGSICLCNEDGKVISDSEADADSTRKIVFGSNGGAIASKGDIWAGVSRTLGNVESQLTEALDIIKNHWHGDAADEAYAHLTKLRDTAGSLSANSGRMGSGLQMMGRAITDTQAAYPDINDDNAAAAWTSLKNGTNDGLSRLPTYVEGDVPHSSYDEYRGPGPGGPGPSLGPGPSIGPGPGVGPGPSIGPNLGPNVDGPDYGPSVDGPSVDGPGYGPSVGGPNYGPSVGGPSIGGPGYTGGGGIGDGGTSTSLAGFDGGSGGGFGPGGPGLAGGAGGALGGGGGLGGGLSGGVGGGLGGAGSAGAGGSLGVAGGPNIGGVGSGAPGMGGGAGRGGMMAPMMGRPGSGGDDDERERSTWLNEDDDLWGTSDAPPPVIS